MRQYLCRSLSLVVAAMDKAAAAKFLGVSERTIERYVKEKKIGVSHINGTPYYSDDELMRFKAELETPIYQPSLAPTTSDKPVLPVAAPTQVDEGLECLKAIAHHYYLTGLQSKMVLTLKEAASTSGLSVGFLTANIKSGLLKAKKLGLGWKIRVQDLQDFINNIYD